MSTIKLEIEVSAENVTAVAQFLEAIAGGDKSKKIEVIDAEEVKAPAPVKTPTPRPSRAKPKPAPVEEEETEEDDETEAEGDFEDEDLSSDDDITADDLRAVQAEKIGKHKAAMFAKYVELGSKGISSLDPKHYRTMFDFISKLK